MNPGTYPAILQLPRIADQLFTTSPKNTDGIAMQFKLADSGEEISTVLWLSPAAYQHTVETLKDVFGFSGDFNKLARDLTLPNYECSLVIENEEYVGSKDGKMHTKPKIRWINSRGGSSAAPPPANGVDGVLQRIAKLAGNSNVNAEFQKAKQAKLPVPSREEDPDGIPY